MTSEHLVELGDTGWLVWRDILLRSPGFPVSGLESLTTPDAAKAVDAHLAGELGAAALEPVLADAARAGAAAIDRIAADPLFREAIIWQNSGVLVTLDHLVREGPEVPHNSDRRQREEAVARYWQRYCAKNETVGFFGPACWGRLDPASADALVTEPGPGLTRQRRVFFEHWALEAVAAAAAADPQVRAAFPPRLPPHLVRDGRRLLGPAGRSTELTATEAVVLARCDGLRSAAEVAAEIAETATALRRTDDVYLLLHRLVERDLLQWDANLPLSLDAEEVLRSRLPNWAAEPFQRLCGLRDEVAAAAGDPSALAAAMAALGTAFTEVTGQPARRRGGQTYAGRTLCHEETSRDLDLALGADPLATLAPPLAPLLQAARWLTVELARIYGDELHRLHDELLTHADGGDPVRLSDLWFLAQGLLFGPGERPADTVSAEFTARWSRLFGLAELESGVRTVELRADELARRVAEVFPATAPGWSAARLHSPDLHLCATDVDAVRAGDYFWVLGELHSAWATFDSSALTVWHPDRQRLREALAASVGIGRVRPLWPVDWPRHSGRLSTSLDAPSDVQLGFTAAQGADPRRLLPATAATVRVVDGRLVAVAPDGRSWPLLEMFSALVAIHAVDAFKLVAARPYTPRITIDRLVVCRETWRTSTAELPRLLAARGLGNRFVEARRWRAAAGLPERVYVGLGSEIKPMYLDFTSPLLVSALCVTLRSAHTRFGATPVVVSEMLPGPEHAWVPDAAGRRYVSELRLHVVDPEPAATW